MPQTQRALRQRTVEVVHPSTRREPRLTLVRRVEYTRFPRVESEQGHRVGFTRDISRSGLCVSAEAPEPVGSLLRLTLYAVDGRAREPGVGRVAWCRPSGAGRYSIGLQLLTGSAQQ